MKSLQEQMDSYAAYHHDMRNKLTHFIGVPLVTFSLFLFLSWFRIRNAENIPFLSGAGVFFFVVFLYYLCLDLFVALIQLPITLALLFLADRVALWDWPEALGVFLGTFVGGWIIQLVGHAFEGKRPALVDNLSQIFNAPLFLTIEVLLLLGIRKGVSERSLPEG